MNPLVAEKTENHKVLLEVPYDLAAGSKTFELEEEEEEDDLNLSFRSHKSTPGAARSNRFQAFLTLFKAFVGSAIFTVPYSFKKAGGGLASIVIVFCGSLALYCMMLAIKVADSRPVKGRLTLEKLTNDILGNFGKRSVQVTMIIMQVGICIGIFILAGQFLDYSFCVYEIESLCGNTTFKVLFFAALTMPISFINNAHYFYIPSIAGTMFLLITVGAQFYYNTQLISAQENYPRTLANSFSTFNLKELPSMFGVATYAFEGIGTLFSIRGAMAKPKAFSKLLVTEMVLLTSLLLLFSAMCATALQDKLPEIALFSLPKDNYFYLVIQIGIVVSNLISYPIQLFPAIMILEHTNTLKKHFFKDNGETKSIVKRYGMRVILISLMIYVSMVAKSFNLFLNLLGSMIFTYIGYILPVLIYNRHFDNIGKRRRVLNACVVVVSVILGAVGAVLAVINLVNYEGDEGVEI